MRVLVVDDNEPLRAYLRDALEAAGHEADVTATAAGALAVACARQPDAILLDIGLPEVTGDVVMPQLMAFAPVIVVTGRDDEALERRLLNDGAFGYLRKPFALAVLTATLDAVVDAEASRARAAFTVAASA